MRCKLCLKTTPRAKHHKCWKNWQICSKCYKDIQNEKTLQSGKRIKSTYCLFCLKDTPQSPKGRVAWCNSIHRSRYYRRETAKRKGIEMWKLMEKNGKKQMKDRDGIGMYDKIKEGIAN